MPRLSLYKPEKGKDYKFIDRQASEMFTVGGTDVYVHKYLGANTDTENASADQPNYPSTQVTNIQDLLFLENRDRTYDPEIYRIRGLYNVQNIDFNVSQFGLFIDNDTLYMTVHINDWQKIVGRKPMSGDVLELPHLRDDFALNNLDVSLPRYYVIADVGRASEGFSSTWFPHLYRLRITRVTDSQQFSQIFDQPATDSNGDPIIGSNATLKDLLSTFNTELAINNQVVAQAEADAPQSGYETRQFYTLAVDPNTGKPVLETADETTLDASQTNYLANDNNARPVRPGYTGYLIGNGYPVNGYDFGFGIQFPEQPGTDDFFLRTDFFPNRLFRFDGLGNSWVKVEDAVRMNMTNNDTRDTLKTGFINNTNYTYTASVASDVVNLSAGATQINTRILFATGSSVPYVVIKLGVTQLEYALSDYPTIYSSYIYTSPAGIQTTCLKITLPLIADTNGNMVQQTIPATAQWTVTLYNTRDSQRQSLSQALKPQADL
jgi:hypothetical protein